MKKIISGLIVIASLTFTTQAQTARNNSDRNNNDKAQSEKHHNKADHKQMTEKLQLTSDQKQQMKSIHTDFKNQMKELKNSNLSTEELNAKKVALQQERKQKTMALLTPEQKEKLKDYKKAEHAKGKMNSAKRMEKMKSKLGLSDDQVAKMSVQRDLYRTKEEAIKNNGALSADQKNEQMKALQEERKNNFKSILTPDQAKKMEEK